MSYGVQMLLVLTVLIVVPILCAALVLFVGRRLLKAYRTRRDLP